MTEDDLDPADLPLPVSVQVAMAIDADMKTKPKPRKYPISGGVKCPRCGDLVDYKMTAPRMLLARCQGEGCDVQLIG